MREFVKVLIIAVIGTALMFGAAIVLAMVLRPLGRETAGTIVCSVVGVSLLAPIIEVGLEKDLPQWLENTIFFGMAVIPMVGILTAVFI
jgi:hypothetical protein